jgi:hypothetical protein
MSEFTRRRLVAIVFATTGIAIMPRAGWGQKKKGQGKDLPPCRTERTFGDWKVTATDDSADAKAQNLPANVAEFVHDYISRKSPTYYEYAPYRIRFSTQDAPTSVTYDVSVSAPDGFNKKLSMRARSQSVDKNTYWADLDLSSFFPDTGNPLKGSSKLTIEISNGGKRLLSMELSTRGFAEAQQFMRAEQLRLDAMEQRKQCESCFFTTACCELIGLADDCFELRTLRAFRDGPLQALPGGGQDIAHYYAYAPVLLGEMRRRGEEQSLLVYYCTHVLPCVFLARLGFHGATRWLYRDLMRRVERRYLPNSRGRALGLS